MFRECVDLTVKGIQDELENTFARYSKAADLNTLNTLLQVLDLVAEAQESIDFRPLEKRSLIIASLEVSRTSFSVVEY